jgi:hypothetical protein
MLYKLLVQSCMNTWNHFGITNMYVNNLFDNTHVQIKIYQEFYHCIIHIVNERRHVRMLYKPSTPVDIQRWTKIALPVEPTNWHKVRSHNVQVEWTDHFILNKTSTPVNRNKLSLKLVLTDQIFNLRSFSDSLEDFILLWISFVNYLPYCADCPCCSSF